MRVLRNLFVLRKQVTPLLLRRVVVGYYTHSTESKDQLLGFVPTEDETAMDVDGGGGSDKSAAALLATTRLRGAKSALEPLRPEVRLDVSRLGLDLFEIAFVYLRSIATSTC